MPVEHSPTPSWLADTMVWGQVNFNEQDPITLDPAWWADYWRDCQLQGVTLNVGGAMAYYPTQVPGHPTSPTLGDGDLLGDTVTAAKSLGLRVLGRLDPAFSERALYDEHPDWFMTQASGEPFTYAAATAAFVGLDPGDAARQDPAPVYLPCSYSAYFEQYVLEICTEVLEQYDIDGIWTNGWPLAPGTPRTFCHCAHCLKSWERAYPGRQRPSQADPDDPQWLEYVHFADGRLEDLQRRIRDHVHRVRPGSALVSSVDTRLESPFRWRTWDGMVDALGIDAQTRPSLGVEPSRAPALWGIGLQSELTRAVASDNPIIRFVATYKADRPTIRHGAQPSGEIRMQMAQALAHGERPKWHTVGGQSHDRRWMAGVRDFNQWMAAHHDWLVNRTSLSDVAVVWSPRTVRSQSWRREDLPSHRDALVGWYLALTKAQIAFEFVHEDFLADLERFKVLVLPSGLGLPSDAVDAIEAYARAGGGLVGSCRALATDEWGRPRYSRLAALRVEESDILIGPLRHAAIDVGDADELIVGLGDTDIIGSGRWQAVMAGLHESTHTAGRFIPDYPVSPTHRIVAAQPDPDLPAFAMSAGLGGAPAIYLAADLDAAHARYESPDHALVLGNAVRAALGDRSPSVEVRGSGLVDVRPWSHAHGVSVFLVNLDNVATAGGVVTEVRPLGPHEVTIRVNPGDQATAVRLLRNDSDCVWSQEGDAVTVEVPEICDFELIGIEL